MSTYDNLVDFLSGEVGVPREQCVPEADLEMNLGITGIEGCELIVAYGKKFSVRVDHLHLSEYFQDEPSWFGGERKVQPLRISDLLTGIDRGVLLPGKSPGP